MRVGSFGVMVMAVALAACGAGSPARPRASAVVRTEGGVRLIGLSDGRIYDDEAGAVVVPGGRSFVTMSGKHDDSEIFLRDAITGAVRSSHNVPNGMTMRAVSADGRLVALSSGHTTSADTTTTIVVADLTGNYDNRTFTLQGGFEPEAFSANGTFLYVIEELPGDLYRVRQLSLTSGAVSDILGKDKEPITEDMSGIRGAQALAPDARTLYTLYLRNGDDGPEPFVHSLGLDGGWAVCVDLPPSLSDVARGGAVAVAPDSRRFYVLSGSPRQLAVVSADTLSVLMVKSLPVLDAKQPAVMTAQRDGTVVVASGRRLVSINPDRTDPPAIQELAAPITSVYAMADGVHVLATVGDRLQTIDPVSGAVTNDIPAAGATSVEAVI